MNEEELWQDVDFCRRMAKQGNAVAQYVLGHCYSNGEGVEQNYAQAVGWYRKAAEQGGYLAQVNLGSYTRER